MERMSTEFGGLRFWIKCLTNFLHCGKIKGTRIMRPFVTSFIMPTLEE